MSKDLKAPNPSEFGLTSFADLLRRRPPIPGEGELSFETFHQQLMASLAPMTPYEAVIAENLIAIEWELLQHRRMRDATLRRVISDTIRQAVIGREEARWQQQLEAALASSTEYGNEADDPRSTPLNKDGAEELADNIVERLIDPDPSIPAMAESELMELGMDALEVMGIAYTTSIQPVSLHNERIQDLERRRRQVKGDLDDLQKARPAQGKIIDG